jgi:hypothetical protein
MDLTAKHAKSAKKMEREEIGHKIIGAAIEDHKALGPSLLESIKEGIKRIVSLSRL